MRACGISFTGVRVIGLAFGSGSRRPCNSRDDCYPEVKIEVERVS